MEKRRNASLQRKLIVQFTAISFAGLSVFAAIAYILVSRLNQEQMQREIAARLESARAAIDIAYEESTSRQKEIMATLVKTLGTRITVDASKAVPRVIQDQITRERTTFPLPLMTVGGVSLDDHALVDQISEQTSSRITLFVMLPQGMVRVSTSVRNTDGSRAVMTYIPSTSPVFQAISQGKPFYGRAFVVDDWYMTAYEPITRNGKVVGALFSGTRENFSAKITAYLEGQKLLATGYFFVLDSKGSMIAHPSLEGKNVLEMSDLSGKAVFQEMINTKNGRIDYNWLNEGTGKHQSKFAQFAYFPSLDWIVAASVSKSEANAGVTRLTQFLAASGALILMVLAGLVRLTSSRISASLDLVASSVSAVVKDVFSQSSAMERSSVDLSAASTEQASALQETAATVEEIEAMVKQNLDSTEVSASLSGKTKAAAEQGFEVVEKLNGAISEVIAQNRKATTEIDKSYQQIQEISQVLAKIDEKTKVINDIVFQTKLLSFNASVEAARAGEHGKGFAVVAEEVGNLAAMTGSSALDIEATLREGIDRVSSIIQASQRQIGASFSEITKQTERCVAIAAECKESLGAVVETVGQSHEAIEQIASASREQTKAIGQISQAIQQIDQATQNNAKLSQLSQQNSAELKAQSQQLTEAVKELNQVVHGNKAG